MPELHSSEHSSSLLSYQPEQGRVSQGGSYFSCPSNFPLNQWVGSFWQLSVPSGSFEFHAVPDNCVDWIIPLHNPAQNQLVRPFISPKLFQMKGPLDVFGIRFRVLGQYHLFAIPIGELDAESNAQDLGNNSQPEAILEAVCGASAFLQRCTLVSAMLNKNFRENNIDRRLQRFLQFSFATLLGKSGRPESALVQWHQLGICERQLRRLSQLYLGLSPKQFIRVLRFQHCLQVWQSSTNNDGYLHGYYDQSHFIREFKAMAGVTPSQFRKMSVLYNKQDRS